MFLVEVVFSLVAYNFSIYIITLFSHNVNSFTQILHKTVRFVVKKHEKTHRGKICLTDLIFLSDYVTIEIMSSVMAAH